MIAILAVLGLVISIFYHRLTITGLRAEIADLKDAAAEAQEAMATASSVAENEAVDRERLAKDRSELMRLRAEVTALRKELQTSRVAPSPSKQTANAEAKQPTEEATPLKLRTYNSAVSTVVQTGGAALSGGWVTSPGKRTFLLMSPSLVDQTGAAGTGERQVVVSGKFIEVPDGAFQPNSPGISHDLRNDTYSGSLAAGELQDLLTKLEATEGVNVLAAPRVLANDGAEAVVAVTQTVLQNGQEIALGPQVTLSSRIGADGSFDMNINSKLTLLPTQE